MDKMISVIIPYRGNSEKDKALLDWTATMLKNQSYSNYEIIAQSDNGLGAAYGRNAGAKKAKGDILLFVGNDCLPDNNLLGSHVLAHKDSDIVQGYTPWHQDVITPFYDFLDRSGLQAAWGNLRNDDGTWKRYAEATFCLTTNYSITKKLFENMGGFNETFSAAAWEDVEFGYRLAKLGHRILFEPAAINYHYHRYDFDSFLARCRMEGYHRLTIVKLHPEMGWNLTNPEAIREAEKIDPGDIVKWAKGAGDTPEAFERMGRACHIYSMYGVIDRIKDELPAMQALKHVHHPAQVIQITSGCAALEGGFSGYASHTAQWFVTDRPDDWSAYSYLGEVELYCGNVNEARSAFERSLVINPRAEWPKSRLRDIEREC